MILILLRDWKNIYLVVVGMCPMPSSTSVSSSARAYGDDKADRIEPTCLVIIEKKDI